MEWIIVAIAVLLLSVLGPKPHKGRKGNLKRHRKRNSKPLEIKITVRSEDKALAEKYENKLGGIFGDDAISSAPVAVPSNHEFQLDRLTHGLIIDQPWIGKILRGEKTWEMRSTRSKLRSAMALIEKGTGTVVGLARLVDVKGPLSVEELIASESKHCIDASIYEDDGYKWNYAWILADVIPLSVPVPYRHKSGSVIWAELDNTAINAIRNQFEQLPQNEHIDPPIRVWSQSVWTPAVGDVMSPTQVQPFVTRTTEISHQEYSIVPVARDGSLFSKTSCQRNGVYTVGEKGNEQRFSDYQEALDYLRAMPVAKWRRPNESGNWGIVSAVEWTESN